MTMIQKKLLHSLALYSHKLAFGIMITSFLCFNSLAQALPPEKKAPTKPVVVELFTSQGCSSCPKADKILQKLTTSPNVIAISFHVDYWDYLGWKDQMASSVNTKRQKEYARMMGGNNIFTPQVIINGETSIVGRNETEIHKIIAQKLQHIDKMINIKLWENKKSLMIEVDAKHSNQPKEEGTVWLALIKKSKKVKIKRGENRGKTLTYHNIVREISPVGRWMGQKMKIRLPRKHWMQRGSDGCVVLLQKDGGKNNGIIRGAAQMISW